MLAAATAVATTVMTKALEKTGEKLGEKVFDRSEQFLASLKQKSPTTSFAIERVQQPLDYGKAVLEVEALAKKDPEIERVVLELSTAAEETPNVELREVIREIMDSLKEQEPTIQHLGKLAEKIGLVVYGGSVSITNLNV
jgi:hypothetical protein